MSVPADTGGSLGSGWPGDATAAPRTDAGKDTRGEGCFTLNEQTVVYYYSASTETCFFLLPSGLTVSWVAT